MARPSIEIMRRAGINLARAARRVLRPAAIPRSEGFWLVVRVGGPLGEVAPFGLPFGREPAIGLLEILQALEGAAKDPQVDGVLLRFSGSLRGWSKVMSLRRAVERLRESGVPVAAYAESLEAEGLLVASAANKLWLPETGSVFLVGLRIETLFLRGILDRLDVKPEVVRIGRYKSAGERFTRERMSSEDREQLEALADDIFEELVDGVAAGRGLDPAALRDLIDRGPYHARAAVEMGLADGCLYPDEIEAELETLSRDPPEERLGPRRVRLVDAALYHAFRVSDPGWRPLLSGLPRIVYVVAHGAIARGRAQRGIASESFRELFEAIRGDEGIRGVVLRIHSAGGDAVASDLLWRSVSLVTREKPVVVSMGDVVASGGYYMASAGDELLAESGTVTGSIGVVGGKINLEGLYRRIGIGREAVERGARAGLLSESRGFTLEEKGAVRVEMTALYETFVDRVARGRGLSVSATHAVAQGRLWSGSRALSLGLVDSIGGPLEALRAARQHAGLRREEPVLVERYPKLPRIPFLSLLLRLIRRR